MIEAPEHRKPVRLAALALRHAIAEDWPKATNAVARLQAECSAEGLGTALVVWCDAFAEHAQGGPPEFQRIRLVSMDVETGSTAVQLPPRHVWARELVQARAEGDLGRFQAKLAQLNSINDGFERGRWVSALIKCVALTIRTFPYGYARMGRDTP